MDRQTEKQTDGSLYEWFIMLLKLGSYRKIEKLKILPFCQKIKKSASNLHMHFLNIIMSVT